MANAKYNNFFEQLGAAAIDLNNDTFKLLLVTSTYTPNIDTHAVRNDVTNEVTGTGYTAGGATVPNTGVTQDDTNDLARFDGDDVVWTASTITARGAVLYKDTGNAATDILLMYFDFGTDKSSSEGDFTVSWDANGIFTIS